MEKKDAEPCDVCGERILGLKVEVLGLNSSDWDDMNLAVVADMRLCKACGGTVLAFIEGMKSMANAGNARRNPKRKKRG
jgi:hypothetical protein